MTLFEVAAVVLAGSAAATDIRSARVPNALTLAAAVLGLLSHAVLSGGQGFAASAIGLLTGLVVFFPFFALRAMGAGDVKLMAALGAWLGWQPTIHVALYGAIAGGVMAILVSLGAGYTRTALANVRELLTSWWLTGIRPLPALTLDAGTGLRLPYAIPILAGVLVTLWRL